jgi:hypothetical protein
MPNLSSLQHQKILVLILAGLGVGSFLVSISGASDAQAISAHKVVDRAIRQSPRFCEGRRYANANVQPVVDSIVSTESTSDRVNLSTTARLEINDDRPIPLQSAHITLKEAQVAVALSQAHLDIARINLIEFQAKHDRHKILSQQGKVSRQQLDTAKAAYVLAQSQHRSALIGLQESTAQLVAAKAEVSRLGRKANAEI